MRYRIIDMNGTVLDKGHWPVRSHILACQIEDYCAEHDLDFVKMCPNPSFTEVTVTVRKNR